MYITWGEKTRFHQVLLDFIFFEPGFVIKYLGYWCENNNFVNLCLYVGDFLSGHFNTFYLRENLVIYMFTLWYFTTPISLFESMNKIQIIQKPDVT